MTTVALFPLRTVLVPGLVLPLHIFEPRYRLMIRTVMDLPEDRRGFGIVAIRPGSEGCEGSQDMFGVGTMARITNIESLPDGRYDLVTVGARRFTILSVADDLPYLRATVQLHDEPVGDPDAAAELAQRAVALLRRYRELISSWGMVDMAPLRDLPDDPVVLSYLVGSAVVGDLTLHQRLLDINDAQSRLTSVCEVLHREIAAMSAVRSMPAVDLGQPVRHWRNANPGRCARRIGVAVPSASATRPWIGAPEAGPGGAAACGAVAAGARRLGSDHDARDRPARGAAR